MLRLEKESFHYLQRNGWSASQRFPLSKPVLETADGNTYMGGSEGLLRINKTACPSTGLQLAAPVLQEVFLDGAAVAVAPSLELRGFPPFLLVDIHVQLKGVDAHSANASSVSASVVSTTCHIETAQPFLSLSDLFSRRLPDYDTVYTERWQLERRIRFARFRGDALGGNKSGLSPFVSEPTLLVTLIHTHNRRMKHKLQEEERKIYKEKVRALININHELRTPLTLIYSPLKQLAEQPPIPREQQIKVQSAFKQARQMKNIIDMILNMQKMQRGEKSTHVVDGFEMTDQSYSGRFPKSSPCAKSRWGLSPDDIIGRCISTAIMRNHHQ